MGGKRKEDIQACYNYAFPSKLRELMKKTNTSQSALSRYLKVTRQSVSLYINGNAKPTLDTLYHIAEFFNVPAAYLLSDDQWINWKLNSQYGEFKNQCILIGGESFFDMVSDILKLNEAGREKVAERVEELLETPRYNPDLLDMMAEKLAEIKAKQAH